MDITTRIKAFSLLGSELSSISAQEIKSLAAKTANQNPWFTENEIKFSIKAIGENLTTEKISEWIAPYDFKTQRKTIALVAAGNIPLVAFHDFISILISGHTVLVKQSSKDSVLLPYIAQRLIAINSEFTDRVRFSEERISGFDAVIATGSDNTARYFDYYFSKYPHVIRKNRASCGILNGFETAEDLEALGNDVFRYFGLGCRNVSKLFVPVGFEIPKILDAWMGYRDIINHHKYANNYDYQKSIMLLNSTKFLDSGHVLMTENEKLVSPIAVVHYEFYNSGDTLKAQLRKDADKIQCIVGNHAFSTVAFGKAQSPALDDYADQIDTLEFLSGL